MTPLNAVRAQIEKMAKSERPLVRAAYRGIKAMGALRRFLLNPRIRSQVFTRFHYKDKHFQREAATGVDRYPELFEQCRRQLGHLPGPRLLSFGCSTGEEVFTLAGYLPEARIVGVDINEWCLKQCERKNTSDRLQFFHRLSREFERATDFDAIFCLAVFQRTEHRTENAEPADTGFTFEHFAREIELLDGKLKPGGLFFLDECDFSFEQTATAAHYQPLDFEGNRASRQRPLFDRENRRIANEYSTCRCFVKQQA